jgi:hypothetical protein
MFVFALPPNMKHPRAGHPWKGKPLSDDPAECALWIASGKNVAMPLEENNRVVADFDGKDHQNGKEPARQFYEAYRRLFGEPPNVIVETPSGGVHFHFGGRAKSRPILDAIGRKIGDLKGSGFVLWIGSQIDGRAYRLLRAEPLQPFPKVLFPIRNADPVRRLVEETDVLRRIKRAWAYAARIEPAISGTGGHNKTMYFAGAMIQKCGLTVEQAWPIALWWNERCQPPWPVRDLLRKLYEAERLSHVDRRQKTLG